MGRKGLYKSVKKAWASAVAHAESPLHKGWEENAVSREPFV